MIEVHRCRRSVTHHQCGPDGSVKLKTLLDFCQDAAAEHAELLGCGMAALSVSKQLWVLSRLKLKVLRKPRLGEQVEIATYPTGFDKIFACRQYHLTAGNEELVQGTSDWLIVDRTTNRPLAAGKSLKIALPDNSALPSYYPALGKIPEPENLSGLASYQVGASQIDLNGHLNNAFYAAFIEDSLELLGASARQIYEIQINFQYAGQLHDAICCSGSADKERFCVSGGKYFIAAGTFAAQSSQLQE